MKRVEVTGFEPATYLMVLDTFSRRAPRKVLWAPTQLIVFSELPNYTSMPAEAGVRFYVASVATTAADVDAGCRVPGTADALLVLALAFLTDLAVIAS